MPKDSGATALPRNYFTSCGLTREELREIAVMMAKDLRSIIAAKRSPPNTLYNDSYHFRNLCQHVKNFAREFAMANELKEFVPWLFA